MTMEKFNDPYGIQDFKKIFDSGIALTCAANSLNKSMGLPDIYPFIISEPVFAKLKFIHDRMVSTGLDPAKLLANTYEIEMPSIIFCR